MTDNQKLEAYGEQLDETFIINDTRLNVLPMDVTLFSDNAIYGSSFLRSRAVFSYRSKHAREKIILTLPISISVTELTNDSGAIYSRDEGLKILTQLSNYPFCFIKSPRIESYVAPAGGLSSAGFMIFGVEQISAVQDMSTPDVIFIEYHLVFFNHTPLIKNFKFRCDDGSVVDYPSSSDQFVDSFSNLGDNKKKVEEFLEDLSSFLNSTDVKSGSYIDGSLPYGSTILLAPHMYNVEENAMVDEDHQSNFTGFSSSEIKSIEISASNGGATSSIAMLQEVEAEDEDKVPTNKEIVNIAWTANSDLSLGGQSALQTVRVTRYNKLAKHFISAHRHPILQYMGKGPSRVELTYLSDSSNSYKTEFTSLIALYTQMFNVLDYNAMMFPAANAYNYLKLRSIIGAAMGVEKLVPNQKFIGTSSDRQGIESLTMSFIESNVEEFLDEGLVEEGRNGGSDSNRSRDLVLSAFAKNYNPSTFAFMSNKYALNAQFIDAMTKALKAMAVEFAQGYTLATFSDQAEWDDLNTDIQTKISGGLLDKVDFISNTADILTGRAADIRALAKAFDERSAYRQIYIYEGTEVAKQKLAGITLNLNVQSGKTSTLGTETKVVSAGTAENFVRNGAVDMHLNAMFVSIKNLADLGDSGAKAALSLVGTGTQDLNNASINSYVGVNYGDLNLPGISASQAIDPMFFLKEDYHLKQEDLKASYDLVAEGFTKAIDEVLTNSERLDVVGIKSDSAVRTAILHKGNIEEQAYVADGGDGYYVDIQGNTVDPTTVNSGMSATQSTFMSSSAVNGKYPDWNSVQLDATQLRAKQAIEKAVAASTLISSAAKNDWKYFLINVAGIESGLGKAQSSGTGAEGLMQITGTTAKAMGYTHSSVASDFNAAAQCAIKYFTYLQKIAKNNGFNNWADLFVMYNLGEGAGPAVLKTYYKGATLTDSGRKGIRTQGITGLNTNADGKTVATVYYKVIQAKFGSLYKYVNKGAQTNPTDSSSTALKKEEAKTISVSRDDIAKSYSKATLIQDGTITGNSFNAKVGGKTIRVIVKGIAAPVPPLDKEITINGSKKILYTEKAQAYGAASRDALKSYLKSGFYIEKTSSGSITSHVFNMNYENVGKKILEQGLAYPIANQDYSGKSYSTANIFSTTNRVLPQVYLDDMKVKRSEVQKGTRKLADIVEKGTTPKYADGTAFNQAALDKETEKVSTNSVNYKPSSVTNNFLPFKSGTGQVTSEYGKYRTKAANGVSREGYHFGIDCQPTDGSKDIVAAAKGVVVQSGWSGGAGQRVRIWHDKIGFSTQYFHLNKIYVKQNQSVAAGQAIGQMGGSGDNSLSAYAVHGHYQVGFGNAATGNLINPFKTTLLKSIPDFTGGTGQQALKLYAQRFLAPGYYTNYQGKDLRSTNKVYTGGNATMTGSSSSGNEGDMFGTGSSSGAGGDYSGQGIPIKPTLSKPGSRGIDNAYSVFNEDLIIQKQMQSMIYPYIQGMNTAFPVVKAYVTVGSDNEDLMLRNEVRLGYYFELNGIEQLKLACNNDENPVDVMVLSLANPSFALTDDYSVTGKYLTSKMESVYGPDEIQWVADRIKLKPGAKLHIRAGYGNDPNKLQTIFNGIITEMSSNNNVVLSCICEGFGRELLATQIEPIKHQPAGGEWHNSSTGLIFSKSLIQDGITHFGTTTNTFQFVSSWLKPFSNETSQDDKTDPEAKRLVTRFNLNPFSGSIGIYVTKGNIRQRLFTNIYAAEIDVLHPQFSSTLGNYLSGLLSFTEKAGYYYIFEGQTPWEAMKEMEFRHPGTKVKPLFYDDRMTMFFGLKEQMYIARDLNPQYMSSVAQNSDMEQISGEYLKERYKRMELVTKMHIASSNTNIISNGLALSNNFCTGVNVVYFEDNEEREDDEKEDFGEFKMTVDDNLNFWEYRYKTISMPGTHGKYSSFMYGTTALRQESEKMYAGKITLIGNPQIKAGDFVFIDDEISKMQGVVKVRECSHFYGEDGFVTEITPGLYIEASNFFYTSIFLRLGLASQISSMLSGTGVFESAFGSSDFQNYLVSFKSIQRLRETTNLDKLNNGVMYNTGGGFTVGLGLTLSAFLGNIALKTLGRVQATSALNLAKLAAGNGSLSSTSVAYKILKAMNKKSVTLGKTGFTILRAYRTASLVRLSALALTPFSVVGGLIGVFAFSYIDGLIQESTLTRQPLMFFPINYVGRPYTAGISGYKYNSWFQSKVENASKNIGYSQKALRELSMTNPDSWSTMVLGWLNGTSAQKAVDKIVTVDQQTATNGLTK